MILSEQDAGYRQCSISVMDNIADPNITFDENGVCNYYYEYKEAEKTKTLSGTLAKRKLKEVIDLIKFKGKDKKYDCVIGVSGGIDSTYLSLVAKKFELRCLCVHFDNGWNSELAVKNIENIIKNSGFELYTYVIDWEEFKDIQLSYFKAGVIDIEAVTDIGISAALNKICVEFNVSYILNGDNVWTEATLPSCWINKNPNNLYQIHKRFGTLKLNNYPAKFKKERYLKTRGNYQSIPLLNYLDYNKENIKEIITQEFDWKDYGGKHYESIFTRFYQGYILPKKFYVDKRKAHLSNLIFSGQITKQEALVQMSESSYQENQIQMDLDFVLKKLDFSKSEFENYMNKPPISHEFYGGMELDKQKFWNKIRVMLGTIKKRVFTDGI